MSAQPLNAQPRALYLESLGSQRILLMPTEEFNHQSRALYLESYVGHESLASRAEPLTTNQEDYALETNQEDYTNASYARRRV